MESPVMSYMWKILTILIVTGALTSGLMEFGFGYSNRCDGSNSIVDDANTYK